MLPSFSFYFELIPLTTLGCLGFYLSLTAGLLYPPWRRKFITLCQLPKPSSQHTLSALDAFRGLCALWVVCLHTWQYSGKIFVDMSNWPVMNEGVYPVYVFFILSGFFLYRALKNKFTNVNDFVAYIHHRFFRLYPLYFITMLIFMWQIKSNPQVWVVNVLMLNVIYHQIIYPPSWSLYLEVMFYILLPFFVVVCSHRGIFFSFCVIVLSLVFGTFKISFVVCVKFFVMGFILEEMHSRRYGEKWPSWIKILILCAGLGMIYFNLSISNEVVKQLARYNLALGLNQQGPFYFSIGILIVIWMSFYLPLLNQALSIFPLRFLGVISYSLYLWHYNIFYFEKPSLIYPGSWPLLTLAYVPSYIFYATLSFLLIEKPAMLYGRRKLFKTMSQ